MKIWYGKTETCVDAGCQVQTALEALGVTLDGVIAARRGGQVLEMTYKLTGDGELVPLTVADDEGRRIYERSVRFVLLLALRRLYPHQQVRVEYSVGHGVFVRLPGRMLNAAEIAIIEAEMHRICSEDMPFRREVWTLADAIAYFEKDGQMDKVALLKHRPYQYFTMYGCGGMWEYFYGAMAASTGAVDVFALKPLQEGFVVQLPSAESPDAPAPYIERPQHLSVFAQSAGWCRILGVNNAADLSAMLEKGDMREFIRINEALHDKVISDIADDIARRGARVILVAGPSSSGKTTFAGRLSVHLRVLGYHPVKVSLDDYYLDRDKIPLEPDGTVDLERIDTLDLPLLQQQVMALLRGERVELPRFSFKTGKREPKGEWLQLSDDQPLIIEGIHGLNPALLEGVPEEVQHRVFVSALTCLNLDDHNRIRTTDVRLLRRTVRDNQFRGTPPRETLDMWPSVRKGEETWIFPHQERAHSMFNTALHYELPFLKTRAYELLQKIEPDDPCYLPARRLLKVLNYVPDAAASLESEIPPTSILREFIGGSTFDAAD
ncbi:MAG: nucleoside kinase [Clostridia bacterium]|nr:nucleoside kinase [Clostridia bacterium]